MKFLDDFRDAETARKLVDTIRRRSDRRYILMDVCGGQTHNLLRYGIEQSLFPPVELIHGPGCPVCVTPAEVISRAQRLALQPGVILTSFGDMLRVPGEDGSLLETRARGGDVRVVQSPLEAVRVAQQTPDHQVVFFAVGFETTAPATALAVRAAESEGIENFSILNAHVRVLPAMEAIVHDPSNQVEGFLAAGHVCAITGFAAYHSFAKDNQVPVVICGFEPLDLLIGISQLIEKIDESSFTVLNAYQRGVVERGNEHAQRLVHSVYDVADKPWRGLGVIPSGGYELNAKYDRYDANLRFPESGFATHDRESECRAADVLMGRLRPPDCPLFSTVCRPESPQGAPMVSSEGACAAYMQHQPIPISAATSRMSEDE